MPSPRCRPATGGPRTISIAIRSRRTRFTPSTGGFLSPVDFHPMEYGILPNALEAIDTSQLLGMVAVDQALQGCRLRAGEGVRPRAGQRHPRRHRHPGAGHPARRPARPSALAGGPQGGRVADDGRRRCHAAHLPTPTSPGRRTPFPACSATSSPAASAATSISAAPTASVDAACGSSLSALNLAALELGCRQGRHGRHRRDRHLQRHLHVHLLQQDAGALALRPCPPLRCRRRRHHPRRRVWGSSSSSALPMPNATATAFMPSSTASAPPATGAARRSTSRVPPARRKRCGAPTSRPASPRDTIELIEAHGTGTKVGDAVEVKALRAVFGEADEPWCALGSVKSQIGHTKAAAGAAGLIKAALALHHKILPPTIKVQRPQETVTAGAALSTSIPRPVPGLPTAATIRAAPASAPSVSAAATSTASSKSTRARSRSPRSAGEVQIVAFSAADRAGCGAALRSLPGQGVLERAAVGRRPSRTSIRPQEPCRLPLVIEKERVQPAGADQERPDPAGEATATVVLEYPGRRLFG